MSPLLQLCKWSWPLVQSGRRLSILVYHRVHHQPDPYRPDDPDITAFDWQMRLLKRYTTVLPLEEAFDRLQGNKLPPRATAVTLDDGYADNYLNALPVLLQHSIPATFFVAPGYLGTGRMFNDTIIECIRQVNDEVLDLADLGLGRYSVRNQQQRQEAARRLIRQVKWLPTSQRGYCVQALADKVDAALPNDLMMTEAHLRALAQSGMTIGGHTLSHPILALEDEQTAEREINEGRDRLRAITGQEVSLFAYPNGKPFQDYGPREVELVAQAGFKAAFSTSPGAATCGSDRLQLPRYSARGSFPAEFMAKMMLNMRQPIEVA